MLHFTNAQKKEKILELLFEKASNQFERFRYYKNCLIRVLNVRITTLKIYNFLTAQNFMFNALICSFLFVCFTIVCCYSI